MLYCYKTSFCPLMNQKHHEWSECNYAHRQQDFRRPPHMFCYFPEKCPYLNEDGSWDNCEHYLDCQYSHSLIEILFNPLHYKIKECPDAEAGQKYQCKKIGPLCAHIHSTEERDTARKALTNPLPKVLQTPSLKEYGSQDYGGVEWYQEYLPEFIAAAKK